MEIETVVPKLRRRLRSFRGQYRDIANSSDDLGYSWIIKFAAGEIPNPTINSMLSLKTAMEKFERERTE